MQCVDLNALGLLPNRSYRKRSDRKREDLIGGTARDGYLELIGLDLGNEPAWYGTIITLIGLPSVTAFSLLTSSLDVIDHNNRRTRGGFIEPSNNCA